MDLKNNYLEIAEAFSMLGLDIHNILPDIRRCEILYSRHKWQIVRGASFIIINAVPSGKLVEDSFWEEWYIIEKEQPIHHILFCSGKPPDGYESVYIPPTEYDGIHPKEIFGRDWYVINDLDMVSWPYKKSQIISRA
jgi:hypothetical protein